jgi:hypothetical protein
MTINQNGETTYIIYNERRRYDGEKRMYLRSK